jgi:hypothetical protein
MEASLVLFRLLSILVKCCIFIITIEFKIRAHKCKRVQRRLINDAWLLQVSPMSSILIEAFYLLFL